MPLTTEGVGWKAQDTAEKAAERISPKAGTKRAKALGAYKDKTKSALDRAFPGLTADECAQRLGWHVLSTRPRVSELVRDGWLEDTGLRRKSDMGQDQIVWRYKE